VRPDQAYWPPTESLGFADLAPRFAVFARREARGDVAAAKTPDSRFTDSTGDVEIIGHRGPMTAVPVDRRR
jgi:hypothetical protein